MWGTVLKRDLLGETREEDKFHTKEELQDFLKSEIERQGKNVVIRDLDVSLLKDLGGLFKDIAIDVETLDLSGWKTSNIENMKEMFILCRSLKKLDLSGWDTSGVKDMSKMFYACINLKSLDVSGWGTSNVNSMNDMFFNCLNLESLDLSGWDTSNVENMSGMFFGCIGLKSLDLSGWDTSNVENMIGMFWECPVPYEVVDCNKIVKK